MASTCRRGAAVGQTNERRRRRGTEAQGLVGLPGRESQNGWVDSEAKAAANQTGEARLEDHIGDGLGAKKVRDDMWGSRVDLASGD